MVQNVSPERVQKCLDGVIVQQIHSLRQHSPPLVLNCTLRTNPIWRHEMEMVLKWTKDMSGEMKRASEDCVIQHTICVEREYDYVEK